jgi:hypothetical protein
MINLIEIKDLIPNALFNALSEENKFESPKKQALELIRDTIAIEIIDSRPTELDYLITPFAWIVEYLSGDLISGVSTDYENRRNKKYSEAFKILELHKSKKSVTKAQTGIIEGLY